MYRKWAEISKKYLSHNAKYCKSIMKPDCLLMAVVKANAYGHGSVETSKILLENGVDWLGVSSLGEGEILRDNGIKAPILSLGVIPDENIAEAIEKDITLTIFDFKEAVTMNEIFEKPTKIHIKLDTGMNRLGFYAKKDEAKMMQTVKEIIEISKMKNIEIEGIFTHFWGEEYDECKEQFDNFQKILGILEKNGINPKIKHCCNSNAAFKFPEFHMDMCRVGKGLYGYYDPHVIPVMELKALIVELKDVDIDEGIGYDHAYIAKRPMKIAIVPIGYADGYFRLLSGKASVCVDGEIVPVVGNVCMDMLMIDVTDLKTEPKIGDEVKLYGREGVTVEMVGEWTGIMYREVLCAVGRRVPRVYV